MVSPRSSTLALTTTEGRAFTSLPQSAGGARERGEVARARISSLLLTTWGRVGRVGKHLGQNWLPPGEELLQHFGGGGQGGGAGGADGEGGAPHHHPLLPHLRHRSLRPAPLAPLPPELGEPLPVVGLHGGVGPPAQAPQLHPLQQGEPQHHVEGSVLAQGGEQRLQAVQGGGVVLLQAGPHLPQPLAQGEEGGGGGGGEGRGGGGG